MFTEGRFHRITVLNISNYFKHKNKITELFIKKKVLLKSYSEAELNLKDDPNRIFLPYSYFPRTQLRMLIVNPFPISSISKLSSFRRSHLSPFHYIVILIFSLFWWHGLTRYVPEKLYSLSVSSSLGIVVFFLFCVERTPTWDLPSKRYFNCIKYYWL